MTCIVALKEKNRVWLGSDSCVSASHETIRGTPKIIRKGEFLIGGAGRSRGTQLFQYSVVLPNICEGENHYHYLINTVTPLMRKTFIDHGFLKVKNAEQEAPNTFILVFRGNVYVIGPDFFVDHPKEGYFSIGSGSGLALGSLYSTHKAKLSPKTRINLALSAASAYDGFVSPPYEIISMEWDGYEDGDIYRFYDSDGSVKQNYLINDKPKGE